MKFSKETTLFLNNSFWSLLGVLISKGLMFFAWVAVANILGKTVNGEIGILRTTVNLFVALVGNGFGVTLTKYLAINGSKDSEFKGKLLGLSFSSALIFGIIISIVYYLLTPWISQDILQAPHLIGVLKLNTFLLFFSIVNGVLIGCLQGFEMFKEISIVNSIYGIILFFALLYGANSNGVYGVFLGFVLATLVSLLIGLLFTVKAVKRHRIKINLNFYSEFKILRTFTLPAILTGLMVIPFKWFLETMLVREPSGYEEMGLFSAIFIFHTLLLMIANTVNAPFIISLSKSDKNKKMEKMNLLLPWGLSLIAITPILLFPGLLGILLDDAYMNDPNFRLTTIFIAILTVLVLFKHGMARIMIINNLMWFSFLSNLIWGVVLLITFYISPVKDAVSISFAYVIAYLINILFIIPFYLKKNIIPKHIVISKRSLIIWCLFGLIVLVSFFSDKIDVVIRSVLLGFFIVLFSINFYKSFKYD